MLGRSSPQLLTSTMIFSTGINGRDGNGDVFVPSNITNFVNFVRKSTGGLGIHFMMADGGFSVEGQENIQEILSKQLYLCQFLVALGIVRTGE